MTRTYSWMAAGLLVTFATALLTVTTPLFELMFSTGLVLDVYKRQLPLCQRLYYMDIDLYRYFIGRDDQSVNESVMVKRVDQQLLSLIHI